MDIEQLKEVSDLLTDESTIQFKNGKTIKGAKEVSVIILKCCEQYNEGYIEEIKEKFSKIGIGVLIGVGISLSSIVLYNLNKNKHKQK
jgi:hypothetical protein